jgi:hypothetical protein
MRHIRRLAMNAATFLLYTGFASGVLIALGFSLLLA